MPTIATVIISSTRVKPRASPFCLRRLFRSASFVLVLRLRDKVFMAEMGTEGKLEALAGAVHNPI